MGQTREIETLIAKLRDKQRDCYPGVAVLLAGPIAQLEALIKADFEELEFDMYYLTITGDIKSILQAEQNAINFMMKEQAKLN